MQYNAVNRLHFIPNSVLGLTLGYAANSDSISFLTYLKRIKGFNSLVTEYNKRAQGVQTYFNYVPEYHDGLTYADLMSELFAISKEIRSPEGRRVFLEM